MLSTIVKEHQTKQAVRKERQGKRWVFNLMVNIYLFHLPKFVKTCDSTEQKRKEAVQAASNLTQALVDHLNVG